MRPVPCPLCDGRAFLPLARVRRDPLALHLGMRDGYRFVVCRQCGHMFQNPQFGHEELQALYPEKYITLRKGFAPDAPPPDYVERQTRAARRRLAFIERGFATGRDGLAALDVGCGGGFLLGLLTERGWRACGVEPNKGLAQYARENYGAEVEEGYFSPASFRNERFDLLVCSHIVEHVPAPADFLRQCGMRLRRGGALYVEVPSPDSAHPLIPLENFLQKGHLHLFFDHNFTRTLGLGGLAVAVFQRANSNLCALARPDGPAEPSKSHWLQSVWHVQRYRLVHFARFGWKDSIKRMLRLTEGGRSAGDGFEPS